MSHIIDRRQNFKGKNLGNRQRFIRRAKDQIKKAVTDSINSKNIKDINGGEKIKIPVKDLDEPTFGKDHNSGNRDMVHPGNKDFIPGDHIDKPSGGQGKGGKQASQDGEGEDEFSFTLTRDEFLDFFFEDLELPDLVKKSLKEIKKTKFKRAGYANTGNPVNVDVKQTLKKAIGRRISLNRPKNDDILEMEDEYNNLLKKKKKTDEDFLRMRFLEEEIVRLKNKQQSVPWIDPIDVKYKNFTPQPQPTSQAVMICIMDVSGSMGEREKELAKRFFILLYLFLERRYEKIEILFVRHTQDAKEVDEHEFFHGKETGGTIVSTGLEMAYDIVKERYPIADWNIYIAQASDGENWDNDTIKCINILNNSLLPITQYYAYIEIIPATTYGNKDSDLWSEYKTLVDKWKHFSMKKIGTAKDIFPVFKELFSKKG
jgi:uncharacterized sporulation protein YeaH/YhbH (DUF444 family)